MYEHTMYKIVQVSIFRQKIILVEFTNRRLMYLAYKNNCLFLGLFKNFLPNLLYISVISQMIINNKYAKYFKRSFKCF